MTRSVTAALSNPFSPSTSPVLIRSTKWSIWALYSSPRR